MPALSSEQSRELARQYFLLSRSVGDYQFSHLGNLTDDEQAALNVVKHRLSDASIHFTAVSIRTSLNDLQPVLDRIEAVTMKALAAVHRLEDVQRVLSVAASAVTLSGAILAGDPGGIFEAAVNVVDAIAPKAETAGGTGHQGTG